MRCSRWSHGSLYPALHRLEGRKWNFVLLGHVGKQPQGAIITGSRPAGRKQLVAHTSRWEQLVRAIGRVLRPAGGVDAMAGDWLRRWTRFLKREEWDQERAERNRSVSRHRDRRKHFARYALGRGPLCRATETEGNPTLIREEIYHMNSLGFLQTLLAGPAFRRANCCV